MTKNILIRKINEGDRAAFIKMSRDFYSSPAVLHDVPDEYHTRAFDELMRSDEYLECLIFEADEGEIAGYALLAKTYSREAGGVAVWIDELYVLPDFRGRGIGGSFFCWLHENIPAGRYRLETEPENERARKLYARYGYKEFPYLQMVKETPSFQ